MYHIDSFDSFMLFHSRFLVSGKFWVLLLQKSGCPSWVGVGHPLFVVREAGRAIRGWRPLPHTGKNNTLATIWQQYLAMGTSPLSTDKAIIYVRVHFVPLPTRNLQAATGKTIIPWLRQLEQFSDRVIFPDNAKNSSRAMIPEMQHDFML